MSDDKDDRPEMRALAAVAQVANERCAKRNGFDCVLVFMAFEQIVADIPAYPGSIFSTAREHSQFAKQYLAEDDNREKLIRHVIRIAADHATTDDLAIRIQARMNSQILGTTARPLFYAVPAETGLAMALAVYDQFWTDRW